jgi:penicillin amidase
MDKAAYAPLWFEAWSQALGRLVMDWIYPPVARSALRGRIDWGLVAHVLKSSRHADTLALAALDSASVVLRGRLPQQTTTMHSWGTVHVAELRHPVAAAFDLPPVARSGDANTVMATGGANFRQTAGASYRQVIDLGNFDNSVAINVPGQSGQPESEHYADLIEPWANGEYFPLAFSRKRVEAETKHVLMLEPAR